MFALNPVQGVNTQLSDELVALRAETDSVVVRAVTNYGAEKHTCFYRLRLFGHRLGKD